MKSLLLTITAACALLAPVPAASSNAPANAHTAEFDHEHAAWTTLLGKYVQGDRVDYAGLKKDLVALEAYCASLAAVKPTELAAWTTEQRFAFWINTYNAYVLWLIVDEYPVKSIKDIGGIFTKVWDKEFIPMKAHHPDGKSDELSLDDVEHKILRPRFKDARVHVAVNCASIGCPPLRNEAFRAAALSDQLDDQMRRFLADTSRNRIDRKGRKIKLSAIFNWFKEDFERDAGSIAKYVARYAPGDDTDWIKKNRIDFLNYSWKLNDIVRKKGR